MGEGHCKVMVSLREEVQRKSGNEMLLLLHLGKRPRKSPRGTRTGAVEMHVTGGEAEEDEQIQVWFYFTQINAHLATGTTIPYISVNQPFFHQDNTHHLQLFNMFTQNLSHMFPWPMCQNPEQLPIKVLLKSSEWEPNCLTWCDTIATQSPHNCLTLKVFGRVSQSTASMCGLSYAGDAGIQTNVNTPIWKTEHSERSDIQKRPLVQRWKLKVRQWNQFLHSSKLISFSAFACRLLSLMLFKNTCMHKWMTFQTPNSAQWGVFPSGNSRVVKINYEVIEWNQETFVAFVSHKVTSESVFWIYQSIWYYGIARKVCYSSRLPVFLDEGKRKKMKENGRNWIPVIFSNRETIRLGGCLKEWALTSWLNELPLFTLCLSLVSKRQAIQTDYHLNYFGYQGPDARRVCRKRSIYLHA